MVGHLWIVGWLFLVEDAYILDDFSWSFFDLEDICDAFFLPIDVVFVMFIGKTQFAGERFYGEQEYGSGWTGNAFIGSPQ